MKHFFSTLAFGIGLSAIAAGNLGAVDIVSANVWVPFQFKVEKLTLPAGKYRVEREFGTETVYVVNVNTGQRIRMIRDTAKRTPGQAILTFEPTGKGYKLAKVS